MPLSGAGKFLMRVLGRDMAHESVLIIDDEPDVLELCQRILLAEGYRVETSRSGYKAIQRIRQTSFDLVLTDIKMPGMDGLETAQAIKEIDPSIICVTMTGYSTMDTAIEALKLGVGEFIVKPFSPTELSMTIAKALEKERLHKENIRLRALIPLFEFNKTLLSTVEVDSLLHHVLQFAAQETLADLSILFLNEEGCINEHMSPRSSMESDPAQPRRLEFAQWIMEKQEFVSLRQEATSRTDFNDLLDSLDVRFLVGLPLVAKEGHPVGALVLGKRAEPFASGDSELLQVMGGQAAVAIENAHLFQQIQQAYEELKQLDHLKSEFINIAAHELRTPLAILMGYASVMSEEADEEDQTRFDIIIRNAMRLGTLINDMLNLNYLETGQAQLRVEEVDLRDVIRGALLDTRHLAGDKALRIEIDVPPDLPPVYTDRQKLDLILMNLLNNAIKYTPQGGDIFLRAWTNDDMLRISVSDSGIGIPPEERKRIFDRFYQVEDSLTRQHGGLGLGLALVKSLVEICRGQIWVESEVGRGSTFTIELPLRLVV
jgi:signal transduction histidine kinase/FixJ family two-component response regulator